MRRKRKYDTRPRHKCAMSYRTHGPVIDGFVEVEGLVLTVLYDKPSLRRLPAIRFSKHWGRAVTVLADMRKFPTLQVFELTDPQTDLCGYVGAAEYDFYHSRFRAVPTLPTAL